MGTKYGGPGLAHKIYIVSEDNPIIDEKFQRTLEEVHDRLEDIKSIIDMVPVGFERDIVQEEMERLESLLKINS